MIEDELVQTARVGCESAQPVDPADIRPPEFSDEALARRFSAEYAERLRYVEIWRRWLVWDGTVWRFDVTRQATDMARWICRQASAECTDDRLALRIASAKTVEAVERLAKADRRHAATVDQWDTAPWLLNTPGGVVDLQAGITRPHDPKDYLTKITDVAPGDGCPRWLEFLDTVTGGDAELAAFLRRIAGYALTGSTCEHALFFIYGSGGNGKSVFLNTLTGLLDAYATVAPIDTFTASNSDRHPTDLAMLRGARLVSAQETEEGRRWAESRIKALTSGDPVTARFMRQDFFTFRPEFKLLIGGNHKPALRNIDEAIRRRFYLIRFAITIGAAQRDPGLEVKLRAEGPGILSWAIEGCLEWQRVGLSPPESVTQATDEYLQEEDAIAQWLNESCELGKAMECRSSALFASWREWAEKTGEYVGTQTRFSRQLKARGFSSKRDTNNLAAFSGVGLKPLPNLPATDRDKDLQEQPPGGLGG